MSDWSVLLVGGASGSGKSTLARPVAAARGAVLVEVDDLVLATQAVTTPDSHPDLHHWRRHDADRLGPEGVADGLITVARALAPAVDAVIADRLDAGVPLVLEGDYLLPEHCARWVERDRRVRAVFVREPDADRVRRNYLGREPESGDQVRRAECSAYYGDLLAAEAEKHGLPVFAARPWHDAAERLAALL
ncbi:hypothetical protein GCM10022243_57670 [Saccharothrix violaceirubra]|uniref:2-phosphoglycerate kinase n=1 Tax=Saccharothrix violaceirubra TaxID=413306 RepID=A0A7W7T3U5_9PSEU|nr:AAA family ATPase [Saccharothrix violaceirubra]MBB4965801.1 2-phosphoglycerate kinase [Saccharothrix violaceirubra]